MILSGVIVHTYDEIDMKFKLLILLSRRDQYYPDYNYPCVQMYGTIGKVQVEWLYLANEPCLQVN